MVDRLLERKNALLAQLITNSGIHLFACASSLKCTVIYLSYHNINVPMDWALCRQLFMSVVVVVLEPRPLEHKRTTPTLNAVTVQNAFIVACILNSWALD